MFSVNITKLAFLLKATWTVILEEIVFRQLIFLASVLLLVKQNKESNACTFKHSSEGTPMDKCILVYKTVISYHI